MTIRRGSVESRDQLLGRPLSSREQQVVGLIARGMTAVEIGAELGTSPRTVTVQRDSALAKLGARSSAHAVALAFQPVSPEGLREAAERLLEVWPMHAAREQARLALRAALAERGTE